MHKKFTVFWFLFISSNEAIHFCILGGSCAPGLIEEEVHYGGTSSQMSKTGLDDVHSCQSFCGTNNLPYFVWSTGDGKCWCKEEKGSPEHKARFTSGESCNYGG